MSNLKDLQLFSSSILYTNEVDLSDVFTFNSLKNLSVYKNNYLQSHLKHLKSVYPACAIVLGENNFNFFMSQFLTQVTPITENLNEYGHDLFLFFKSRDELSDIQYISFVAQLEWAIFDQEDEEIELPSGVYELWKALTNNNDPSNIEIDENILEKIKFE